MSAPRPIARFLPFTIAFVAVGALVLWWMSSPDKPLRMRVPGTDAAPATTGAGGTNPVYLGRTILGMGRPADLPGAWPQFRGPNRTGAVAGDGLALAWPGGRPLELWSVPVGEGYAGPAVAEGRVFLMDYDRDAQHDVLRSLSLADGQEIWRFTYPIAIKRNHGMTRTVPAIQGNRVVAIGPKCHVICCDVESGELIWTRDLVREYGGTVPEWYTGQCPLIDGEHVILAPGGPEALLLALRLDNGEEVWRTPNPELWKMSHSSVMPLDIEGVRQYIYCANKGVVGVDASNGHLFWQTTEWRISIATVPSPVVVDGRRIFLSGGYDAGSLMIELAATESGQVPSSLFRLDAGTFGATQHTPVLFQNHLYGIRQDGRLVCLSLDGRVVWDSGSTDVFGLGPLLLVNDLILAMDDSGLLRLIKANPAGYEKLGEADVLDGRESWGTMALAGSRLLVRDFTRLKCLDVGLQ